MSTKHKPYNKGDLVKLINLNHNSERSWEVRNTIKYCLGHTAEVTNPGIKKLYIRFTLKNGFGQPIVETFHVWADEVELVFAK